ncbi:hypothetical protein AKJ16_DCAP17510 [Drosera capensis]
MAEAGFFSRRSTRTLAAFFTASLTTENEPWLPMRESMMRRADRRPAGDMRLRGRRRFDDDEKATIESRSRDDREETTDRIALFITWSLRDVIVPPRSRSATRSAGARRMRDRAGGALILSIAAYVSWLRPTETTAASASSFSSDSGIGLNRLPPPDVVDVKGSSSLFWFLLVVDSEERDFLPFRSADRTGQRAVLGDGGCQAREVEDVRALCREDGRALSCLDAL